MDVYTASIHDINYITYNIAQSYDFKTFGTQKIFVIRNIN